MGQGRNSVYLANHGWNVTGFDVSKAGERAVEDFRRVPNFEI